MSNKTEWQKFVSPNMRVVMGVAGLGGVVMGSFCLWLAKREQRKARELPFRNRAISLLKSNSMAVELIGPPIEIKDVEVGDSKNNFIDPYGNGRLKLPLKGRKMSGDLYVWATNSKLQGWVVDRLEFKVADRKNTKTFIVYDNKVMQEMHPRVNLNVE